MESFFYLILDNLFFVIIIIVAIFNFFNKLKEEGQGSRQEQAESERKNTKRATVREKMEEVLLDLESDWKESKVETVTEKQVTSLPSIEEQRQVQYERLRNQYQKSVVHENNDDIDIINMKSKAQEKELGKITTTAHHKISKQSLVDGVIMAEILGPPRALKPYKSVVQERRG